MMLTNYKRVKETGQTLLFVVVAVTIALTVGVSVSTRTLNSTKRVSRTDTSTRVTAAAEGGIESLLGQTDAVLEGMLGGTPNCTPVGKAALDAGSCEIDFPPVVGDNITARAIVKVERFKLNNTDNYSFNLDPGNVKEIALSGYGSNNITICWANVETAIYYSSYNSTGSIKKGGLTPSGFSGSSDVKGFTSVGNGGKTEYVGCGTANLVSNPYGLRIRTLYASSKVAVFPSSTLPDQGYKITSRGELTSGSDVKNVKVLTVYKSFPYAASIMDYGLYTQDALN